MEQICRCLIEFIGANCQGWYAFAPKVEPLVLLVRFAVVLVLEDDLVSLLLPRLVLEGLLVTKVLGAMAAGGLGVGGGGRGDMMYFGKLLCYRSCEEVS